MTATSSEKAPEPIWTATFTTPTGHLIEQRLNFAAYELLLWERMVRAGR